MTLAVVEAVSLSPPGARVVAKFDTGDPALLAIVRLSLVVSLSAVALAALIGIPFGAFMALTRFRGREAVIVLLNALMGLPPVVVGLLVYLLLSRAGPLGALGIFLVLFAAWRQAARRPSPVISPAEPASFEKQ